MSEAAIKFNTSDRPEFYKTLRKKVNLHFKENGRSKFANWNMKLKTVFMLSLYFVPFVIMLSGVVSSFGWILLLWSIMGFGMAGIGLSVMHDANHGSYSRNQKVNQALGYLANFLGAYHLNWKIQHNVLHHSFTNIHGHDEDIKNSVMRLSPDQDRKKLHRFQVIYAPFFYGIMTLYWFISKDFEQILRYEKKNLLVTQKLTYKKALTQVIVNKVWYALLFLVLPMIVIPIPWWQVAIGYICMQFICGLFLALIFQPAHVCTKTDFFDPGTTGTQENGWAIHQMKTTSNFANGSIFFSWFIGGLNYQIEHHLFPNICHVHYSSIAHLVKETAEEYDLPYHHTPTFLGAVRSHFSMLHQLGKAPSA